MTKRTSLRTFGTRLTGHTGADLEARSALDWLKRHGTKATREGTARYAIPSEHAFGVPMNKIQLLAKQLGRNHELAGALWNSGWHEARLLASYVDDPALVTPAQMDRWCRDFDTWGVCDTVCFALFDRTPHAWRRVDHWARCRDEFGKRSPALNIAAMDVARRLARSAHPAERWVGTNAARELTSASVIRRLAKRRAP